MAQIAVSFIVTRVGRKLSDVLIQESARLVEVADQIEWIGKELRYMQATLEQSLQRSNHNQLEWELEEDIRSIALQAEDVIETFLRKTAKKREKGVQYLLEQYDIAKELEPICDKVREISTRIRNYELEQIAVTVETPPVIANTIVSLALKELDIILTKNLIILDEELIEIVEHVKDKDLGDTHNIVSNLNLNSTEESSQSERAKVWLADIKDICDHTVGVAENFIATRERLSRTGWLWQVFYLFEQRVSNRKFKQQMEYISTQLEDALYRRWTFGDGGKDMGDKIGSRSRPAPSLSLVRLTLPKVPFFVFNSDFVPLLFVVVIVAIEVSMFSPKRKAREPEPRLKKKKKSTQLTTFLWFNLVDFMVYVFLWVFPASLWMLLQFVWVSSTVIAWIVSFQRGLDENLKTIRRYLAQISALFSDIKSAEGLNERQQVWVDQLRLAARKGRSLEASPKPRGWHIFNKIIFAEDIKDSLNEILDISDKKNIYGFANIQGRKKLASTVQGSESENIAEHSGAGEHPQPHASSSSYQRVTGLRWKYQLITDEVKLMDALFHDVQEFGELEGRSKLWVEQMQDIASEARAVIHQCDSELEHINIFKYLVARYKIMGKIDCIIDEIEDASKRRNTYGLVQLQSRNESLSTVQILRRRPQPSLIGKESTIVGFDEDVEFLTDHLLSNRDGAT